MNNKRVYNLVLMAILTALCYVGTFVMIPLPTGDKIHLGNLVCIIASLLLGGLKGGMVGSIGMALNDLHFYLDTPSTIIRTLIVKFLMGLVAGIVFKSLFKKNTSPKTVNIIMLLMGLFFIFVFGISLYYALNSDLTNEFNISVSILVPITSLIFAALYLVGIFILSKKIDIYKYTMIAASLGILTNIVGEFSFRIILYVFFDRYGFEPALIMAMSKLPAAILTGIITIVVATCVLPTLRHALAKHLD